MSMFSINSSGVTPGFGGAEIDGRRLDHFRGLSGFLRQHRGPLRALGFHRLRGSSEVVSLGGPFLLRDLLAPHVLILRVGLLDVVEAEALTGAQLGDALVVAPYQGVHAPLRVRRRTRSPAAEILLVFDLQRADVPLDLAKIVVDGGHSGPESRKFQPKARGQGRQPSRARPCRKGNSLPLGSFRPGRGGVI